MVDTIHEKKAEENENSAKPLATIAIVNDANIAVDEEAQALQQQTGWKYRDLNIGPIHIPCYASPQVQTVIMAVVCFLCPGMFNALNGMGGGGQLNHAVADDANTALFATFAIVGFFAGSFVNVFGIQVSAFFGALGYSVYIGAFLCYSHTQNSGYTIFAGALLGCCAGLLWTAQGVVLMSYPPEESKGRYISWFWMIFNMGAAIGSLIPLGQNIHVQESRTVTDGTYVGFLTLSLLGAALSWTLLDAKAVRHRADGSAVTVTKRPSWRTEAWALPATFQSDPHILLLFPMFFASNWYFAYEFNDVNGVRFDTRSRALNNTAYYLMEILGAGLFGHALDVDRRAGPDPGPIGLEHQPQPRPRPRLSRRARALLMWIVLLALTTAIWAGTYVFQRGYTRVRVAAGALRVLDWDDGDYAGPMVLYMMYGFFDAGWQTCVYWTMANLTSDGRKLAHFAGIYKGIQAAGAAIVWHLDGAGVPYLNIMVSCWALLTLALFAALPVYLFKIGR